MVAPIGLWPKPDQLHDIPRAILASVKAQIAALLPGEMEVVRVPAEDMRWLLWESKQLRTIGGDPRDAEIAALKAEGAMLADKAAAAIRERDQALAACAEMRAALEHYAHREYESRRDADGQIQHIAAEVLSRTDLGRGWASPEDTAQMVGALQMVEGDGEFDSLHEVTRKFVVDVLALLGKAGG